MTEQTQKKPCGRPRGVFKHRSSITNQPLHVYAWRKEQAALKSKLALGNPELNERLAAVLEKFKLLSKIQGIQTEQLLINALEAHLKQLKSL